MADGSICRNCFHSYVCEKFNENRDANNQKCHFYNDHYVSQAGVVEVIRCKDCGFRDTDDCPMAVYDVSGLLMCDNEDNDFCSYGERKEK